MRLLSKEIKIPSDTKSLSLVEKFVEEICDTYHIANSYYGNILLAIEEAVKNAIIHGNKEQPGKYVILRFQARPAGLSFTVSDEGEGFDYRNLPNPLEPDDRAAESAGRGIFLIRTLADETSFNPRGNKIEMNFWISSINRDTAIHRANKLSEYFTKQKTRVI